MNIKNKNKWRILPKISYTNYKAEYPIGEAAFKDWFSVSRLWSGRIISFFIRHHSITFDFRKDEWADMMIGGDE